MIKTSEQARKLCALSKKVITPKRQEASRLNGRNGGRPKAPRNADGTIPYSVMVVEKHSGKRVSRHASLDWARAVIRRRSTRRVPLEMVPYTKEAWEAACVKPVFDMLTGKMVIR